MRGLVLRSPLRSGWAHGAHDLLVSGAHAVVLGDIRVPLEAEDAGFEVRDCLLVLGVLGLGRAWLLRKPLSCGTLAEQVLATGTGGLWVDGCRSGVGTVKSLKDGARRPTAFGMMNESGWKPTEQVRNAYGGTEGLEEVTLWVCTPGCPVPTLDEQSGEKPPSFRKANTGTKTERLSMAGSMNLTGKAFGHHDSGGASRFFPQFASVSDLDSWLLRLILGEG